MCTYYNYSIPMSPEMKKADIVIDLGWYPSHKCDEGSYILYLVKDYNWEKPLEKVDTQDKQEVIKFIEKPELVEVFGKASVDYCYEKFDVNKVNCDMINILGVYTFGKNVTTK